MSIAGKFKRLLGIGPSWRQMQMSTPFAMAKRIEGYRAGINLEGTGLLEENPIEKAYKTRQQESVSFTDGSGFKSAEVGGTKISELLDASEAPKKEAGTNIQAILGNAHLAARNSTGAQLMAIRARTEAAYRNTVRSIHSRGYDLATTLQQFKGDMSQVQKGFAQVQQAEIKALKTNLEAKKPDLIAEFKKAGVPDAEAEGKVDAMIKAQLESLESKHKKEKEEMKKQTANLVEAGATHDNLQSRLMREREKLGLLSLFSEKTKKEIIDAQVAKNAQGSSTVHAKGGPQALAKLKVEDLGKRLKEVLPGMEVEVDDKSHSVKVEFPKSVGMGNALIGRTDSVKGRQYHDAARVQAHYLKAGGSTSITFTASGKATNSSGQKDTVKASKTAYKIARAQAREALLAGFPPDKIKVNVKVNGKSVGTKSCEELLGKKQTARLAKAATKEPYSPYVKHRQRQEYKALRTKVHARMKAEAAQPTPAQPTPGART